MSATAPVLLLPFFFFLSLPPSQLSSFLFFFFFVFSHRHRTPTLSSFSRAPIVALTYHTHALSNREKVGPFPFNFFFFFSFFFFFLITRFDASFHSPKWVSPSSDEKLVIFAELRKPCNTFRIKKLVLNPVITRDNFRFDENYVVSMSSHYLYRSISKPIWYLSK